MKTAKHRKVCATARNTRGLVRVPGTRLFKPGGKHPGYHAPGPARLCYSKRMLRAWPKNLTVKAVAERLSKQQQQNT
jgi:hypothetical protein